MACHTLEDKNKIGPSLKGIVGRKAATMEGFQVLRRHVGQRR